MPSRPLGQVLFGAVRSPIRLFEMVVVLDGLVEPWIATTQPDDVLLDVVRS